MFSRSDLAIISTADFKDQYDIRIANAHDINIHSRVTGHDWVIISNYARRTCIIMHRHSNKDPFHRQQGSYESLQDAIGYICRHDIWFSDKRNHHQEAAEE